MKEPRHTFGPDSNAQQQALVSQPLVLGPGVQIASYGNDAAASDGIETYWNLFRLRIWFLTRCAFTGIGLGVLATLLLPRLYEAKISLEIQDLNDNFLNMKQVLPVNDTGGQGNEYGDIQTQIKILQSQSVLNPVVAKMPAFEAQLPEKITPVHSWLRRVAGSADANQYVWAEARRLANTLKVRAVGQTRIVELTAESTSPRLAADFLNQLSGEYIEQNMKSRWEMSQRTSQSLAHLLEDAQRNLRQSETALQSYAQSSGLLFTSDKKSVAEERLSQLQDALSKAQADRIDAQSRYEVAQHHLTDAISPEGGTESFDDALSHGPLQIYEDKLADLRRQRAELATTYTPDYSKVKRLDAQIASLLATISQEQKNVVRRSENAYLQASRREALLAENYGKQSALVSSLDGRTIQYNILQRELDGNREVYDAMLKQVKEATLATAIPSSNVRVLDHAVPPDRPDSPKLLLNCALGLLTCLSTGLFWVFVREQSDHKMREPGDGLRHIGLPELGVVLQNRPGRWLLSSPERKRIPREPLTIPAIEPGGSGVKGESDSLRSLWPKICDLHPSLGSDSLLVLESCRAIVTSFLLSRPITIPYSLAVTSPGSGEGKTTVVANMGLILALMGRRVLLVDGDLRRPLLHQLFSLDANRGLSTLLQQGGVSPQPLATCVQETAIPGLSLLASGPSSVASANLLYSGKCSELLWELKKEYEFVLIDTPPVLQVADARVIGRFADGIILVVRAGQTARNAAAAAHERLNADGANVVGLVLNDWDPSSSSLGYYAEYARSYGKTA
jgi:succinoglycan biosynthesis transport protein ExoP